MFIDMMITPEGDRVAILLVDGTIRFLEQEKQSANYPTDCA
jgi:hypothetical protein